MAVPFLFTVMKSKSRGRTTTGAVLAAMAIVATSCTSARQQAVGVPTTTTGSSTTSTSTTTFNPTSTSVPAAGATTKVSLTDGFQESDGSRWGRPVDAVPGPDGNLYVSDDTAGAIYRLSPPTD
jgi:hypothetical protein